MRSMRCSRQKTMNRGGGQTGGKNARQGPKPRRYGPLVRTTLPSFSSFFLPSSFPLSLPPPAISLVLFEYERGMTCVCARMHSAASASTSASPASRWRGLGSLRSLERETSRRRTSNRGPFIRLIIHIIPACPKLISLTLTLRERKNRIIQHRIMKNTFAHVALFVS